MEQYFYEQNGEQRGPVVGEQLPVLGVRASSLVWAHGMTEWAPAGTVDELRALFPAVPPPLPQPAFPAEAPVPARPAQVTQAPPPPDKTLPVKSLQKTVSVEYGIAEVKEAMNKFSELLPNYLYVEANDDANTYRFDSEEYNLELQLQALTLARTQVKVEVHAKESGFESPEAVAEGNEEIDVVLEIIDICCISIEGEEKQDVAMQSAQSSLPLRAAGVDVPTASRSTSPASTKSSHPQFSADAEASTRRWWHYVIYAIAVFAMLLLFRACGVLLSELVSVAPLATPARMSPSIAQGGTHHWKYTPMLSYPSEKCPAGQPKTLGIISQKSSS